MKINKVVRVKNTVKGVMMDMEVRYISAIASKAMNTRLAQLLGPTEAGKYEAHLVVTRTPDNPFARLLKK